MIKSAKFTTCWDRGQFTTECKVDTETKRIFDIEMLCLRNKPGELIDIFVVVDGVSYPIIKDDMGVFFYDDRERSDC